MVAQRWTHLVTVFDDGDVRQYMDGVLVNSGVYPNGSFNNIDLFKLGVNRAGNAYFEGMIDEVMVWDVALEDEDITALRRTIIDNCTKPRVLAPKSPRLRPPSPCPTTSWTMRGISTFTVSEMVKSTAPSD